MALLKQLKIKMFMDGADLKSMKEACQENIVKGFTTNPTLMRQAGISDYEAFAKSVIAAIPDRPISFEVFSDDFETIEQEARKIASWGGNTYIKIPITNTKRHSSIPLIKKLSKEGFCLNVTAILTIDQVLEAAAALNPGVRSIVSVFAGRIADTGRDPVPMMKESVSILAANPNAELLWASSRELLNIFQAATIGCHIITVTKDILKKLPLAGKDLNELSLDTVKMFYQDAQSAGFRLVSLACEKV